MTNFLKDLAVKYMFELVVPKMSIQELKDLRIKNNKEKNRTYHLGRIDVLLEEEIKRRENGK